MKRLSFLFMLSLLLVCGTSSAQTPDGETPANEGVCDDLMFATPGLYGLCVAFCEAQDCEPDLALADPLENCTPSSEKILRNYERKMNEGDPPMPCIMPPPSCPCWTLEEIEAFMYPSSTSLVFCTYHDDAALLLIVDGDAGGIIDAFDEGSMYRCTFGSLEPPIMRQLSIDQDAYEVCRSQVIQAGVDRNIACFLD